MKYFAIFLPMKDEEKSKHYRQEHLDFLAKERQEGRIFLYGRLTDGAGGLIIYQGHSLVEITSYAKQDPYVTTGARGFEVHEWDMQTDYTFSQ
ncbi:MAG TPA: YciI family protein [Pseudogracilibacillus sp.]|nr:YciI family protein [Pseudogracilibacillus sp.]